MRDFASPMQVVRQGQQPATKTKDEGRRAYGKSRSSNQLSK
ncbi:hypothetical protein ANO14919_128250 [Xylariales sp. No.14919]|nr:hypothetical protein ANO14919_128250 [Xylariales sp. No.14919]